MGYDLLHFTIYACIYLPLAGLLYACAIYLIRLCIRVSYGHIHRYSNKFLFQIFYKWCICGTKWDKVVRVGFFADGTETSVITPVIFSPCHVC